MTIHIGMLLYPGLTQLDLTAPFEVLHRVPDTKVDLVWKTTDPPSLTPASVCSPCLAPCCG